METVITPFEADILKSKGKLAQLAEEIADSAFKHGYEEGYASGTGRGFERGKEAGYEEGYLKGVDAGRREEQRRQIVSAIEARFNKK